jgi:hypothetical protein
MTFGHRASDVPWVSRVWWCHGDTAAPMTSLARAEWDLVLHRGPDGVSAALQGAESAASRVSVPAASTYLGIRFALGASLVPHRAATIVDTSVPLPTEEGDLLLGQRRWRLPEADEVEAFVVGLVEAGLLTMAELPPPDRTTRTAQRHHRSSTGLTRDLVRQVDRARLAAASLRAGESWPAVVEELGYVDQAHLTRAMRRFVGHTPGELGSAEETPLSFLYKTPGPRSP